MAGKIDWGDFPNPNDPMLAKAYCEGRTTAVKGGATSANPHGSTTPAGLAWLRGFASYEAAGTITGRDNCAEPWKLAARTFTITPTDLTAALVTSPAMAVTVDWGDGTIVADADGTVSHTYEAEGDYTVRTYFQGMMLNSQIVTVVEP
jgi:PKD repeat protein